MFNYQNKKIQMKIQLNKKKLDPTKNPTGQEIRKIVN